MPEKMTGWKTRCGGLLIFSTGVLQAAAQAAGDGDARYWLNLASTISGAAGAGLLGVGIGHKVEKGAGNEAGDGAVAAAPGTGRAAQP